MRGLQPFSLLLKEPYTSKLKRCISYKWIFVLKLVISDFSSYPSRLLLALEMHTHPHTYIYTLNIGTYSSKICLFSVVGRTHRKEVHDKTRTVQLHF